MNNTRTNSPSSCYSAYLKMVSAFADMEEAVPHFSSSAASQKAKFSPVKNMADQMRFTFISPFSHVRRVTRVCFHSRCHINVSKLRRNILVNK